VQSLNLSTAPTSLQTASASCLGLSPCTVAITDPAGTVTQTLQPLDTTVTQVLTGSPVVIANLVGLDLYQIVVEQTGPSTFNVITSGPPGNCQVKEEKTVNGVVSTDTSSCNTNSTTGVSGETKGSVMVGPK
jgi:hypothetical protein